MKDLETREQRADYCRRYLTARQRCRTDLFFLANEILAPPHSRIMTHQAHDAFVDHCQKFDGCVEAMHPDTLKILASEQKTPLRDLEGPRQRLLLASRGHLKTTIQVEAHVIQIILNYPDVRILIGTATGDQAERIVKGIKGHFQYNKRLRHLFPEFCPADKKAADFGSSTEFTVPNRKRMELREPTVMTGSLGKALASAHYDWIKFSDVVTEANCRTSAQIQEAKDFVGNAEPLRERFESKDGKSNTAWLDIEGTIYDFADLYSTILDAEKAAAKKQYHITVQPCWKDEARRIPYWPERFPPEELDRIKNDPLVGPYIFSCQYELNPVAPGTGLATPDQIKFVKHDILKALLPAYRIATTIDVATLDGTNVKGDYCGMVTAGFDRHARLDVLSIQHGRFTDEQLIELMFLIQATYPANREFRIQKDQISSGLRTLLKREMVRRGKWLNIQYVPIPTNESKTNRIIRNLRGWFALGLIRFSDSIASNTRQHLIDEILRFPRGAHDDILDALADQMHDADGEAVTRVPRPPEEFERSGNPGLPPPTPWGAIETPDDCFAEVTGV